jgi:hypothetical protein
VKEIKALIQPSKLYDVVMALHRVHSSDFKVVRSVVRVTSNRSKLRRRH